MENARKRFPHIRIQHHIQRKVIEKVYNELQIPLPNNKKLNNQGDDDSEVDEEVEGAYDEDDDMI